MEKRIKIFVLFLFLLQGMVCDAQFWPFNQKSSEEKATEKLEERKQDAGEGNLFNPLQPLGMRSGDSRDDHIWAASTAAVSYHKAGNISITSPSRYGISSRTELLSWLGLTPWVPNIFFKRQISGGDWWISSLHGVYTSYPGFKRVEQGRDTFLADSLLVVPEVVSLKNELLLSRPFYSGIDCRPGQPYLVLSASLGIDVGLPLSEGDVWLEKKHFFTPRSKAYSGEGWMMALSVRADWQASRNLFLRGELRALAGNFPGNPGWEHQASGEYFLLNNISVSGGYVVGFGDSGASNPGLLPFIDVSFYFGNKQSRKSGLFEQQMF
ncbi:MAG: hypothetical protein R6U46_11670 [Marinilabilia sp.]